MVAGGRANMRLTTVLAAIVLAVTAVGLMACQESGPPTVSLVQAKDITARFASQSLTPPPKSIDDVLKGLAAMDIAENSPNCKLAKSLDEDIFRRYGRGSTATGDGEFHSNQASAWAWKHFAREIICEASSCKRRRQISAGPPSAWP